MSSRSPRRLSTLAVAGATAAVLGLGLAGCGAAGRPGNALVIDGRAVTSAEVAVATEQINSALSGDRATEGQVVNLLALAPFVLAKAAETGAWAPDNQFNSFLAKITNPTPATVEALRANSAYVVLTAEDRAALLTDMAKASIQVDPRYGVLDYGTGFLGQPTPEWIVTPATAAPAQ
ncbi:MAG: hypothetical protein WAR57_12325 [Candidatus Phosphoribacter sp.]|nr:hypothetical protein [Actinomycetales bacterium]